MQSKMNPIGRPALVAGIAILIMALTVPVVEFYIFPTLIDRNDPAKTVGNIIEHRKLFSLAIFIHFGTIVCDLVSGWALYLFLKPVNKNLALLSAWFRIINGALTAVALGNLLQIIVCLNNIELINAMEGDIGSRVMYNLRAFDLQWRFMLIFFGTYMILIGFLTMRASYVPNLIGLLLLVGGVGYIIDNLKYFFYRDLNTGFLWFTYFGELVFMFWLIFRGSRLSLPDTAVE